MSKTKYNAPANRKKPRKAKELRSKMTTKIFTIQGAQVELAVPFAEGHVLTTTEAAVLNQTYLENIRNNTAKAVKEALAADKSNDEIQELVTQYAASYEFGVRAPSGTGASPIEREALKLAKMAIRAHVKAKYGVKLDQTPEGMDAAEWSQKVAEAIESAATNEEILEQARENVERAAEAKAKLANIKF